MSRKPVVLTILLIAIGATAGDWPKSSNLELLPLDHPTPEERAATLEYQLEGGFQFLAFGDQRALADGEWQALIEHAAAWEADASRERPVLFVLDTGDIVEDGRHSDQFDRLRTILRPIRHLPYLVSVGNHELSNERDARAREHAASFLRGVLEELEPERLYWRRDFGPIRLIALDSNAWVYEREDEPPAAREARLSAQLEWLEAALDEPEGARSTVVALHHPLIQSSKKHRDTARKSWAFAWDGRRLVDRLADAGVDLVVTGHTHSCELFRLTRDDGRSMWHLNLSGRPRNAFLWFGKGSRRARDIAGRERKWLQEKGFEGLDGWEIKQSFARSEDDRDQMAFFTVEERGALRVQIGWIAKDPPHAMQFTPELTLLEPAGVDSEGGTR